MRKISRHPAPPLHVALGADPVQLWIGGALVAQDEHTPINIRRARGVDGALGEPASCSVTVAVDTLPTWAKGDALEVKLSDTALTQLYGDTEDAMRTNYALNPAAIETTLTGYHARPVGAWSLLTNPSSYPNDGPVSTGEYVRAQANSATPAVGSYFGYGLPLGQTALRAKVPQVGWNIVSMYVRTSIPGVVVRGAVEAYDTTSATQVAQGSPDTWALIPGQWHRIHQAFQYPAGTTPRELIFESHIESADRAVVAGDTFDITGVLIEAGDQLRPYFDGDHPPGPGTTAWLYPGDTTSTGPKTAYSTYTSTAVATYRAQAEYRFKGLVSDLEVEGGRNAPALVSLVATSTSADLGATYLGDAPWPVEGLMARAQRIITAAKAANPDLNLVDPTGAGYTAPVRSTDVDRTSVAQLLAQLSTTAGPGASIIERRDGALLFSTDLDNDLPHYWLSYEVVRNRLKFARTDRVNDVTVRYGPEDGPAAGVELRRNRALNPSFQTAASWTFVGPTPTYDFTAPKDRSQCLKVVTTAVATDGYQDIAVGAGSKVTLSAYYRAGVMTGPWRVVIQAMNGSNVELGVVDTAMPTDTSGAWVRASVVMPATPAGTTKVRIHPYRSVPAATAGQTFYVDAVLCEFNTDDTPGTYFDGATADSDAYTYSWNTANETTQSTILSTGRTPRYQRQVVDAFDIGVHGHHPAIVDTVLDITADPTHTTARANAAMSDGDYTLPDLVVDLLPMLDGSVATITDPIDGELRTPAAMAARLLRAEVGSQSRVSTFGAPGTEWPHLPAVNNITGNIVSWRESISAREWLITTTTERNT